MGPLKASLDGGGAIILMAYWVFVITEQDQVTMYNLSNARRIETRSGGTRIYYKDEECVDTRLPWYEIEEALNVRGKVYICDFRKDKEE